MKLRAMLALAAGVAAAAPACAKALALPCRLPVGERFTATLEQHGWTRTGAPSRILISRTLEFDRDAQGLLVLLGSPHATSNLQGAEARRLAVLYGADAVRDVRLRLDGQGRIVAIEGIEGHWRDYVARIETLAAMVEAEGGAAARSRAMLATLARADNATKLAAIGGPVEPYLRQCGQAVDVVAEPLGDAVTLAERSESGGVTAETRYRIARASGLTLAIDRQLTPQAQPARPLVEHWRLDPLKP